jgi:hypothetical protein
LEGSVGVTGLAEDSPLLPNPATGFGARLAGSETLLRRMAKARPATNQDVLDQVFSELDPFHLF